MHVVMTAGATQFITPLTLQTLSRHPVTTNIFDEKMSWNPGHIELADNADLVLIAPATADILAKLAHGFADDALTSIVLATEAPLLLGPGHERQDVAAPRHSGQRRNPQTTRRRFHRPGKGHVSLRLRRNWASLASRRNRRQGA